MSYRVIMAGATALALTACAQRPPLDGQQRTALADSVAQFVAGPFLAAFNGSPNVDTILALYAPGADIQSAMDGKILPNRDSILAATRAMYGRPHVTFHYTLATPQVAVLSRDAAVYSTMVAGTMKDSAGVETPGRFAWTGVFVRIGGHWKLQAEHGSSLPAPAAATPAPTARPRR